MKKVVFLILFLTTVFAVQCWDGNYGAVAWFPLDNDVAGDFDLCSGNSEISNQDIVFLGGVFNNATELTTNTANIRISEAWAESLFKFDPDFSLSFWVKPDSSNSGTIRYLTYFKSDSGNDFVYVRFNSDDRLAFYIKDSSGQSINLISTDPITHDQWTHVVYSFDSSVNSLSIYLNNIFDVSVSNPSFVGGAMNYDLTYSAVLGINGASSFVGLVDEYAVFNYSLSSSDVSTLYNSNEVSGGEGVTYRIPFDVTEQTGSSLLDYQVLLELDTATLISEGKMVFDCRDLRVKYEGVDLPFWVEESTCNSASTKIWTKVDLSASETKTLYVHYGNSSLSSASNGFDTFVFFDDFDDGNINGWTLTGSAEGQGSSYTEVYASTDQAKSGSYSMRHHHITRGDPNYGSAYASYTSQTSAFIAEFSEYVVNVYSGLNFGQGTLATDYSGTLIQPADSNWAKPPSGTLRWIYNDGSSEHVLLSPLVTGSWYDFKAVIDPAGNNLKVYQEGNPTPLFDGVIRGGLTFFNRVYPCVGTSSSTYGHDVYYDDIRIRKYASTEPTVVAGSEEVFGQQLEYNSTWWNESWGYRQEKNFTSTITLSDYQVYGIFNTTKLIEENKLNSDCSDFRVISPYNSQTELPYWVEDCGSSTTKVWTKLQLFSSKERVVHFYYGNTQATSEENGLNVFIFFDDFEDGNVNGWLFDDVSDGFSVVSPDCYGSYCALFEHHGSSDETGVYKTISSITSGVLEYKMKTSQTNAYHRLNLLQGTISNHAGTWTAMKNNGYFGYYEPSAWHDLVAYSQDTWYDIDLVVTSMTSFDIYVNGNFYASAGLREPASFFDRVYIFGFDGGNSYYDNIFIHKYSSTEPSVVEGSEETFSGANTAPNVTLEYDTTPTSTPVTITMNATDSDGVSSCALYVNDTVGYTLVSTSCTTYDLTVEQGHSYEILFSANDTLGLWSNNVTNGTITPNLSSVEEFNSTWFDVDFIYRKKANITENSGESSEGYQIELVLDTTTLISTNKMNSDCSDIRVAYPYDSQQWLPIYIENCDTATTTIWSPVDLPASEIKSVFVYYGNVTKTSVSDPEQVFDFYDDFNDGSIDTNKWFVSNPDSIIYELNGELQLLRVGPILASSSESYLKSKVNFTYNYVMEISSKTLDDFAGIGGYTHGWYSKFIDSNNYLGSTTGTRSSTLTQNTILKKIDGVYTQGNFHEYLWNEWHNTSLEVYSDSHSVFLDGAQELTQPQTLTAKAPIFLDIWTGNVNADYDYDIRFDYVKVRKLVKPIPTIEWFAEESILSPPVITSLKASPLANYVIISWQTNLLGDSLVEWGLDQTYVGGSEYDATEKNSHSISFSGLSPETLYYFKATSCNNEGCNYEESSFTTLQELDTIGPSISGATLSDYSLNSTDSTTTLTFYASDAASLIGNAEYLINTKEGTGVTITPDDGAADSSTEKFVVTINKASLSPGKNIIYFRASDSGGNNGVWGQKEVAVVIEESSGTGLVTAGDASIDFGAGSGRIEYYGAGNPSGVDPLYNEVKYAFISSSGDGVVTFAYDPSEVVGFLDDSFRVLHFKNGEWVELESSIDLQNYLVSAYTDSFSAFALVGQLNTSTSGGIEVAPVFDALSILLLLSGALLIAFRKN